MDTKKGIEFLWTVVDGAITHQSPRAWVFDSEEAAVKFRCEKIEKHSRRHGSLSPVYKCKLNGELESDMLEIDWSKYPLAAETKHKKFQ